jgi:hypothetical protein
MPRKKTKSAGATPPSKARRWRDPDDAPEITDAMLDRATIVKGDQRGRAALGDSGQNIKSDLSRVDRHQIAAHEYHDAPEIGDDFFDRAEIRKGGKLIRRGRPPLSGKAK